MHNRRALPGGAYKEQLQDKILWRNDESYAQDKLS